jgi:hypothetical protein
MSQEETGIKYPLPQILSILPNSCILSPLRLSPHVQNDSNCSNFYPGRFLKFGSAILLGYNTGRGFPPFSLQPKFPLHITPEPWENTRMKVCRSTLPDRRSDRDAQRAMESFMV